MGNMYLSYYIWFFQYIQALRKVLPSPRAATSPPHGDASTIGTRRQHVNDGEDRLAPRNKLTRHHSMNPIRHDLGDALAEAHSENT